MNEDEDKGKAVYVQKQSMKIDILRHRNANGTLLQQELHSATAITISTQTARIPFHAVGQYACRPIYVLR